MAVCAVDRCNKYGVLKKFHCFFVSPPYDEKINDRIFVFDCAAGVVGIYFSTGGFFAKARTTTCYEFGWYCAGFLFLLLLFCSLPQVVERFLTDWFPFLYFLYFRNIHA